MPSTFFSRQLTRSSHFKRDNTLEKPTLASYYQFQNYARPSTPSPSEIVICRNESDCATTIVTPRLLLRSFNQIEKHELMAALREMLMDPINVQQYWDGVTWAEEKIEDYIHTYSLAWQEGKKFSVYAVYDVLNPDQIIGILDLRDSPFVDYENTVALGYILLRSQHGKKIGKEIGEIAWQAFVHEVKAAIDAGEAPPAGLIATAHPDNHASVSILKHILGDAVPGVLLHYAPNQPRNLFFRRYEPTEGEAQLEEATLSL